MDTIASASNGTGRIVFVMICCALIISASYFVVLLLSRQHKLGQQQTLAAHRQERWQRVNQEYTALLASYRDAEKSLTAPEALQELTRGRERLRIALNVAEVALGEPQAVLVEAEKAIGYADVQLRRAFWQETRAQQGNADA